MSRSVGLWLGASILLGTVAACSSAPASVEPSFNPATVTGGGRHYSFPGSEPPLSRYPDPCSLLPLNSAEALIGAPVTAANRGRYCFWTSKVAVEPVLTVGIRKIGDTATAAYDASVQGVRGTSRLPGIGRAATEYSLGDGDTVRVEVRTQQVYFRVQVQSPVIKRMDVERKQGIAERTAKLVAAEFR